LNERVVSNLQQTKINEKKIPTLSRRKKEIKLEYQTMRSISKKLRILFFVGVIVHGSTIDAKKHDQVYAKIQLQHQFAVPKAQIINTMSKSSKPGCYQISKKNNSFSEFTVRGGDQRFPIVEDISKSSPKSFQKSSGQQRGGVPYSSSQNGNQVERSKEDEARAKEAIESFLKRDNRNTFIARVYAILSGQLLVTAASIWAFSSMRDVSMWMATKGRAVPFLSLALSSIAWYTMNISVKARRESPLKWKLLALFTFGEAFSVGWISSFYHPRTVISAMVVTSISTGVITLYTLLQRNPKYDLSQWGAGLSSAGIIFLLYGVVNLLEIFGIIPRGFLPFSDVIYSALGATLFSFYLAYHTRLIVSGKSTKYQMNDKDYIFGAMCLYNDIINIFLFLLRLLEDRDSGR